MATVKELKATARPKAGKGAARAERRAGRVPAVIYGDNQAPLTISLDDKAARQAIFAGHFLGMLTPHWMYESFLPIDVKQKMAMIAGGAGLWLAVPVAFVIGTIGAISVFKAVYIDRRELRCACVGGDSHVPLGFVSLTEDLMMVAMAVWMGLKYLWPLL